VRVPAVRGAEGTVFTKRSEVSHPESRPQDRSAARLNDYQWKSSCRGIYQLPIAS
jgi:hypothetical protein